MVSLVCGHNMLTGQMLTRLFEIRIGLKININELQFLY